MRITKTIRTEMMTMTRISSRPCLVVNDISCGPSGMSGLHGSRAMSMTRIASELSDCWLYLSPGFWAPEVLSRVAITTLPALIEGVLLLKGMPDFCGLVLKLRKKELRMTFFVRILSSR